MHSDVSCLTYEEYRIGKSRHPFHRPTRFLPESQLHHQTSCISGSIYQHTQTPLATQPTSVGIVPATNNSIQHRDGRNELSECHIKPRLGGADNLIAADTPTSTEQNLDISEPSVTPDCQFVLSNHRASLNVFEDEKAPHESERNASLHRPSREWDSEVIQSSPSLGASVLYDSIEFTQVKHPRKTSQIQPVEKIKKKARAPLKPTCVKPKKKEVSRRSISRRSRFIHLKFTKTRPCDLRALAVGDGFISHERSVPFQSRIRRRRDKISGRFMSAPMLFGALNIAFSNCRTTEANTIAKEDQSSSTTGNPSIGDSSSEIDISDDEGELPQSRRLPTIHVGCSSQSKLPSRTSLYSRADNLVSQISDSEFEEDQGANTAQLRSRKFAIAGSGGSRQACISKSVNISESSGQDTETHIDGLASRLIERVSASVEPILGQEPQAFLKQTRRSNRTCGDFVEHINQESSPQYSEQENQLGQETRNNAEQTLSQDSFPPGGPKSVFFQTTEHPRSHNERRGLFDARRSKPRNIVASQPQQMRRPLGSLNPNLRLSTEPLLPTKSPFYHA